MALDPGASRAGEPADGTPADHARRLIVNADDYGYFDAVSRGILAAADAGRVTATGVLVTSPAFARNAPALRERTEIDVGLHLNLSYGEPLSTDLRRATAATGGKFPRPGSLAAGLLSGGLSLRSVVAEARTQIDRCLEAGLVLRFLNSHEHVHMLPSLYPRVQALAREYGVPFVRHVRWEWPSVSHRQVGALLRTAVLALLDRMQRRNSSGPILIGSAASGRLDLAYLAGRLSQLAPGRAYELMCHPGYRDVDEVREPRLLAFHRWEEELELLTGADFASLCQQAGVVLTRFRDLPEAGVLA
jgi:hypothetical protein